MWMFGIFNAWNKRGFCENYCENCCLLHKTARSGSCVCMWYESQFNAKKKKSIERQLCLFTIPASTHVSRVKSVLHTWMLRKYTSCHKCEELHREFANNRCLCWVKSEVICTEGQSVSAYFWSSNSKKWSVQRVWKAASNIRSGVFPPALLIQIIKPTWLKFINPMTSF